MIRPTSLDIDDGKSYLAVPETRSAYKDFFMGRPDQKKEDQRPDAWERFERAVDSAVKSGPKHRNATKR